MTCSKKVLFKTLAAAALFSAQFGVHAAGMVPETSLLVIDEATHSGTINVKNTDSIRRCCTPTWWICRMIKA